MSDAALPLYICLDATDGAVESQVLAGAARVKMLGATSATELVANAADDLAEATAIAVWHTIRVDDALLQRFTKCRAIVRMGVGYDNVDIAAAGRLGISVCNIPDYGTEEVADSAIALTLGLFRGALAGARLLTTPGLEVRGADAIAAAVPYVRRVRGSTLGLVGLGRVRQQGLELWSWHAWNDPISRPYGDRSARRSRCAPRRAGSRCSSSTRTARTARTRRSGSAASTRSRRSSRPPTASRCTATASRRALSPRSRAPAARTCWMRRRSLGCVRGRCW